MQERRVLVGHRPVVHLATNTVVGWRLGRTRTPEDPVARAEYLREAVCLMADTLLATDRGHHSMRFAVVEAPVDEAGAWAQHVEWAMTEFGLPGSRFGIVFPGSEVAARPDQHVHLRRLAHLGAGVGFDDPELRLSAAALADGLPITRLRLRVPMVRGRVDDDGAVRLTELVELARRHGVRTTVTAVDSPAQESVARRAGADVGTGDQLGPVCEVPVLDVRPVGSTMDTLQRLSMAVLVERDRIAAVG